MTWDANQLAWSDLPHTDDVTPSAARNNKEKHAHPALNGSHPAGAPWEGCYGGNIAVTSDVDP
jgi:hypothetical protein